MTVVINLLHIHDMCPDCGVMSVLCTPLLVKCCQAFVNLTCFIEIYIMKWHWKKKNLQRWRKFEEIYEYADYV